MVKEFQGSELGIQEEMHFVRGLINNYFSLPKSHFPLQPDS